MRLLTSPDYVAYSLAVGMAALVQTLISFGLARVVAKFVSGAGETLRRREVRTLTLAILAFRLIRLVGVLAWVASARSGAASVLWISATTSAIAAGMLIGAALNALASSDNPAAQPGKLDWKEVHRTAVGGYGGTLSWLIFSPAVIRLLASRLMPIDAFAGFSFVQTLAVSAQRYMPSFTLFPLVEPAAMADATRTGRPDHLAASLSLLVKLDAVLVGAAMVGLSAAGAPLILVLTHGRYGEAAVFLPWLLVGIVANASHRSYEIAAIGLGAAGALAQTLGLTVLWMILAVATTPWLGIWPLLLCPLGDALTRFWFVQRALTRRRAPDVIDRQGLGVIAGAAVLTSLAGAWGVTGLRGNLLESLLVGVVCSALFLLIVMRFRPVRTGEAELLQSGPSWLSRLIASGAPRTQRPVRVAVLTPRGRGGTGGVDRLVDSLRPIWTDRHDVEVRFVTTRGQRRWASPAVSGLALVRLAAASALGRIDVIHVNLGARVGCYRKMALIAIPCLLRTPYVLHLHGSAFAAFWAGAPAFARRRIDRLFLDAERIIVLGEAWRRLVADRLPEVASRTVVAPNATAPVDRRRMSHEDGVRLLFLGEVGARKGSPILIEALSRLDARSNWHAVIAGDGDLVAAQRQVEAHGLLDRVRLPGWVGPEEVAALLAASHILVLPSMEENLPMSVIEAFGAGLAVVATPVGALPDTLIDGRTGLLVQPGDVAGLAEALSRLIDQPALRKRLGAAAKTYHAQHLSLAPYADRLTQIWISAIGNAESRKKGYCQKHTL